MVLCPWTGHRKGAQIEKWVTSLLKAWMASTNQSATKRMKHPAFNCLHLMVYIPLSEPHHTFPSSRKICREEIRLQTFSKGQPTKVAGKASRVLMIKKPQTWVNPSCSKILDSAASVKLSKRDSKPVVWPFKFLTILIQWANIKTCVRRSKLT